MEDPQKDWLRDMGIKVDYPKEYRENLEYRYKLIREAETDEGIREVVRERARRDIWFFFNVFLWTYDPRSEAKSLPFVTYGYQDEYIWQMEESYKKREDLLTEKSRDMGATWMALGFILHKWLFEEKFACLMGTYIEDLVDNRTIDSHFGRLEYMITRLPFWLSPAEFDMAIHRNSMKLENPATSGLVTGYAPTERFSRAGRYNLIFVDELAFWKHGRSAWTAMGDASKCRFVTSTPNGKGNKFAELALKSNIKKVALHWRKHPHKDEAWYEAEKRRRTEEEVAQELDINYNKSVSGRVYPELDEWNFLEKQEYDPKEPLYISWDFGLADPTAMIWLQRGRDGTVRVIDAYQNEGKAIDFFVPFVTGQVKSFRKYRYTQEELEMIERHSRWQEAIHFGDPTGDNKHQSSTVSVIKQLRDLGIVINYRRGTDFTFKQRCTATKMLIRRLKIDKDLNEFIDALQNARYPVRGDLNQGTTEIVKPVHDWTSHFRTALEFYAVNEEFRGKGVIGRVKEAVEDIGDNIFKLRPMGKRSSIRKERGYRTCA